jgi:hypothetical protein
MVNLTRDEFARIRSNPTADDGATQRDATLATSLHECVFATVEMLDHTSPLTEFWVRVAEAVSVASRFEGAAPQC